MFQPRPCYRGRPILIGKKYLRRPFDKDNKEKKDEGGSARYLTVHGAPSSSTGVRHNKSKTIRSMNRCFAMEERTECEYCIALRG